MSERVTSYSIVTADTFEELENAVNSQLVEGWQLYGGLVATDDDLGDYLAQVMVMTEPEQ